MDTWQLIEDGMKALQPFYNQVDSTRKRLNMTPYKMIDPLLEKKGLPAELDDVINVTENRSVTHMTRIIAGLMASKWQTVVEGQVSTRESHKIEQFLEGNFQQTDEYLFNVYGMAGLDAWLTNHVCHTSLIGVRWMCRVEDGEYKVFACPLDMRWTPFVLGKWTAPITWRTKDELLKELEGFEKEATDDKNGYSEYYHPGLKDDGTPRLKDTDNEVRDFMDSEKRELWVEKQLVFKQPNIYGRPPDIIVWTPSGFMFRDKGYLAHESPGVNFANEGLYDQLSRQLSIDATLAFNVLNPPREYETKNPSGGLSRRAPKRGETLEVGEGERTLPVPNLDINRAELASRDQVNALIEGATPSAPKQYTSPPSAIEVSTEVEILDQLQNPRVIALQMFKSSLAKMMIEQFIQIGEGAVNVGRMGNQHNFSKADLKDPKQYVVNFQLHKQNKRIAIVNEARALAMWGKAPTKYILRDVLGVEDPDGWEREMELEKAKAANPALGILDMAVRYAEEAEDLEGADKDLRNWQSIMMQHQYIVMMRQMMNPMPAEAQNVREATKETNNAGGLVNLLGAGR